MVERDTSLFQTVRTKAAEYVTEWSLVGLIAAVTGFAPEKWFEKLFHFIGSPDALRFLQNADYRWVPVSVRNHCR
jgi:hypothetical protein